MRIVVVLFPLLCNFIAFVLALLCIFAGSKPGFMENYDLLTLNTSMLGEEALNTSSSSSGSGILGQLEGELGDLENDLKNDLNGAMHSIAQALNIHDFYSSHIQNFCEGYYEPGPVINATVDPWKNVTDCSNATGSGFAFDPQAVIQSQLKPGISLQDLKWPSEVEDAIHAAEAAVKAMFVLYCIGIALAGVALLGATIAIFTQGKASTVINGLLSMLAFLALGIASAIASALIVKAVNALNQYGNDVGITAYKGSNFLALTWVATVLVFVGSLAWFFNCGVWLTHSRTKRTKAYV